MQEELEKTYRDLQDKFDNKQRSEVMKYLMSKTCKWLAEFCKVNYFVVRPASKASIVREILQGMHASYCIRTISKPIRRNHVHS